MSNRETVLNTLNQLRNSLDQRTDVLAEKMARIPYVPGGGGTHLIPNWDKWNKECEELVEIIMVLDNTIEEIST